MKRINRRFKENLGVKDCLGVSNESVKRRGERGERERDGEKAGGHVSTPVEKKRCLKQLSAGH